MDEAKGCLGWWGGENNGEKSLFVTECNSFKRTIVHKESLITSKRWRCQLAQQEAVPTVCQALGEMTDFTF